MRNQRLVAFTAAWFLLSALAGAVAAQESARGSEHNRKGRQYFEEAYYKQLPNGRQHEADRLFDLAAAEFQDAIADNPRSAEAHRNLARLYYVRNQFPEALDAYRSLTVLEPDDIDARVQLALCYGQTGRLDEAIRELEVAKSITDEPEAVRKLDEYIRKAKERRQD